MLDAEALTRIPLTGETRGGCLSIRKTDEQQEVVFSYRDRIDELTAENLRNIVLNFVETSLVLRKKLAVSDDDTNQAAKKVVETKKVAEAAKCR